MVPVKHRLVITVCASIRAQVLHIRLGLTSERQSVNYLVVCSFAPTAFYDNVKDQDFC